MRDVGFCAYNLHGLDVELRHFPDSNNFATLLTVLTVFSPVEILFSLSSAGALLDQAIQACPYLTHIKRTFIGRTYFNETYGALMAEKLSYQPCPNLTRLGESSCYLALACCGALIRYVEHVEDLSFAPSTLRIRFRPNDDTVFLDVPTLEGLEVLTNARPGNGMAGRAANASLLRIMDKTKTRAGKRFLRRSLLEPCAHLGTISTRQDAVEELGNCEDMYFALSSVLSRFPDLERAMSALMARENARLRSVGSTNELTKKESTPGDESEDSLEEDVLSCHATRTKCGLKCQPPSIFLIQNILTIKAGLEAVQPMLHAIHKSKCSLLQAVAESLRSSSLSCLYESIVDVIEKDALPAKEAGRMRMQGAFAVKAGRNG